MPKTISVTVKKTTRDLAMNYANDFIRAAGPSNEKTMEGFLAAIRNAQEGSQLPVAATMAHNLRPTLEALFERLPGHAFATNSMYADAFALLADEMGVPTCRTHNHRLIVKEPERDRRPPRGYTYGPAYLACPNPSCQVTADLPGELR